MNVQKFIIQKQSLIKQLIVKTISNNDCLQFCCRLSKPIRHRITYKLCTLMHNVHIGKSQRYLADIVQPILPEWHAPVCSLSLWNNQLHHTSAAHQVLRAGFLFLLPIIMELSPHWTTHHSRYNCFKEQVEILIFLSWHSTFSRFYQFMCYSSHTFCFTVSQFLLNFYCSAPMFLRQFVIGAL